MKLYYESKPGELEHGLFGFGKKKKKDNAKYIAKIPTGNGKYRYFYTQEEYLAYMKEKKRSDKRQESVAKSRDKAYKNDVVRRATNWAIENGIYNPEPKAITGAKKDTTVWSYTSKGWVEPKKKKKK